MVSFCAYWLRESMRFDKISDSIYMSVWMLKGNFIQNVWRVARPGKRTTYPVMGPAAPQCSRASPPASTVWLVPASLLTPEPCQLRHHVPLPGRLGEPGQGGGAPEQQQQPGGLHRTEHNIHSSPRAPQPPPATNNFPAKINNNNNSTWINHLQIKPDSGF